jgi:protein TonB
MTIVAAIQSGVIVALINGLAVHFIQPPPIPNPQATDVPVMPLAPLPPPPKPQPSTAPETRHPDIVKPPFSGLNQNGTIIDLPLPPINPPSGGDVIRIDPTPVPTLSFVPRPARPRGDPGLWATTSDYPTRELRDGNQGATRFSLAIGTDGKVQSCTVTVGSGFPGLDKATCENVSRRARFEPATDGSGNRVPGIYSGSIRWVIPQD